MKVLVTGSGGLLGTKLSERIDRSGDQVIGLGRSSRGNVTYPYYKCDITDYNSLYEIVTGVRPDVIVNAAAMTQVDLCEEEREKCREINIYGVENIVRAATHSNAYLVHVSTDFVFDGTSGPLDEEAEPSPVNYYGECKLEGEKVVMKSDINWSIARTVLVYGVTAELSRSNIVLWVRESLMNKKPIRIVNDQWRTPTLAEDLAEGCYLLAKKRPKGIYHISGRDMLTPYQIAMITAEHFGLDKSLISETDSNEFQQKAARPLRTGFKIDKARRELGYEPHSFNEGLVVIENQLKALA